MRTKADQKLERVADESWNAGNRADIPATKPLKVKGKGGARDGARTRDLRRDRPAL